jgi:hypothetical protein
LRVRVGAHLAVGIDHLVGEDGLLEEAHLIRVRVRVRVRVS